MVYLISQSIGKGPFRTYDYLDQAYQDYYGAREPLVPVPNRPERVFRLVEQLKPSGIILTGGSSAADLELIRDKTERTLLDAAVSHNIPVFGVCRGLHVINQYFGGAHVPVEDHVRDDHTVYVTSRPLAAVIGGSINTNSYHTLGVTVQTLAKPLVALGVGPGKNVEILAHQTLPITAVQWHPERENTDQEASDYLFRCFEEQAARRAAQ